MRFPRIKKVRLESVDGDEKKASETSTDEEIWRIFDETRSKRLDADSMFGSQSQTGAVSTHVRRCRFLTPEEFGQKARKRKKKVVSSPARKVPKVEVYESNLLEGLRFCVLEGIYSLDASSFDARVAQEQRWAHTVENVKTEEDVIEFIKKHGGTYKAKVTGTPNEFIIGGTTDDARVKTQINGLEYAKSLIDSKKKTDKELVSVAQYHDGIIKWTFVYSLVHRLQKDADKQSFKDTYDRYLIPEPHQYLVRVSRNESIAEALFSLNRPISVDELEHALGTPAVTQDHPWQFKGSVDLPEEERWILSSRYTSLWPYNIDGSNSQVSDERSIFVLYPDVFSSGFGFSAEKDAADEILSGVKSARWEHKAMYSDEIMSALPLVSVMGGLITPHLHAGVTHIICLLKAEIELPYEGEICLDLFVCEERGRHLMDYLSQEFFQKNKIKLVSPDWIRNKLKFD